MRKAIVVYPPDPDHRRAEPVCLTEREKETYKRLASCVHHTQMRLGLAIVRRLRVDVETASVD